MKNKTQKDKIIGALLRNGYVSRNQALKHHISRLSAIIINLNNEGWSFRTEFVDSSGGKDYVYWVEKSPIKKIIYKVNGQEIVKYETTN